MQVARFTPTEESELVNEVHINTAEIPDFVRDNLAAATLDLIHGILRQPGGREAQNPQPDAQADPQNEGS